MFGVNLPVEGYFSIFWATLLISETRKRKTGIPSVADKYVLLETQITAAFCSVSSALTAFLDFYMADGKC